MKGRFLYVGGFQLPDKNAAAQRVMAISQLLRMLDYDVVFLDVSDNLVSDHISALHQVEKFSVFSQRYPRSGRKWASYILTPLHVAEVLNLFDNWLGIIAYNYPAVAMVRLKKLCHNRNMKLIADCTEWYQAERKLSIHNLALLLDSFLRMCIVQKRIDGVIAISSYLTNYYQKHVEVVFLPPMVDLQMSKWSIVPKALPLDHCNLVYAGSPGKYKDDLVSILQIVIANKETELFALGIEHTVFPIPDADRTRIHLLGRKSHLECLSYIMGADYFLLFRPENRTTLAGFPTKFAEGVSCGVPVLCSDVGDPADYVKKYGNGIIVLEGDTVPTIPGRGTAEYVNIKTQAVQIQCMFDYRNYDEELAVFMDNVLAKGLCV